jgi:hypothetical protein
VFFTLSEPELRIVVQAAMAASAGVSAVLHKRHASSRLFPEESGLGGTGGFAEADAIRSNSRTALK